MLFFHRHLLHSVVIPLTCPTKGVYERLNASARHGHMPEACVSDFRLAVAVGLSRSTQYMRDDDIYT